MAGYMKSAESAAGTDARIRYRLTGPQLLFPSLLYVLFMSHQVMSWLSYGTPLSGSAFVRTSMVLMNVLYLGLLARHRWFGVTLTPTEVIVHNFRRRTIPWTQIRGVQAEPFQSMKTVVLYDTTGRRTRLRAPITGFLSWDRHFEEKFHTIGSWWQIHHG